MAARPPGVNAITVHHTAKLIAITRFHDDMAFVGWAFGKMHWFFAAWSVVHLAIVSVFFPVTLYWLKQQKSRYPTAFTSYNVFFATFTSCLIAFTLYCAMCWDFSVVMKLAFLCEQVRLIMKLHSYVEENKRKFTAEDKEKVLLPTRSSFVYFLFAPTLIYKDTYPRTTSVRWPLVLAYFMQFLLSIFVVFATIRFVVQPAFANVGVEPMRFSKLL